MPHHYASLVRFHQPSSSQCCTQAPVMLIHRPWCDGWVAWPIWEHNHGVREALHTILVRKPLKLTPSSFTQEPNICRGSGSSKTTKNRRKRTHRIAYFTAVLIERTQVLDGKMKLLAEEFNVFLKRIPQNEFRCNLRKILQGFCSPHHSTLLPFSAYKRARKNIAQYEKTESSQQSRNRKCSPPAQCRRISLHPSAPASSVSCTEPSEARPLS